MKEKKHIQPSPIVFKVSNVAPNRDHYNLIFSAITFLLLEEESGTHGFFDYIKEYFTPNHFHLLEDRFRDKRNKEVPINQQHLIIFYSIFHLMIIVLASEKEMELMKDSFTEADLIANYELFKTHLTAFSTQTLKTLRKDYLNNNRITVAFAKIDAYKF